MVFIATTYENETGLDKINSGTPHCELNFRENFFP